MSHITELPPPTAVQDIVLGRNPCTCVAPHECQLIVITGGPGAGKTAVLNFAMQVFCKHIALVPEAASIVFGGGFWRRDTLPSKKGAQRAIFHVQRQLESILLQERVAVMGLCDRGTIDSLAYWPSSEQQFWHETGTSHATEMARYKAVIHLRTPNIQMGYDHSNPVRIESAELAAEIDQKLLHAWSGHPNRVIIDANESFATKVNATLEVIRQALPVCCQSHSLQMKG